MTPELIAMLGGGLSGFVMKLIGAQMENQARQFDRMLQKQGLADESADRASARGGVWVRRSLVAITFFAIVVAPFIVAFTDIGVSIALAKQTAFWGYLRALNGTLCRAS
jgi:hypothetical protein